MPERNRKDMVDVPEQAQKEMEFFFIKRVDEILPLVLAAVPERLKALLPDAPAAIIPPPPPPPSTPSPATSA